MPIRKERLGQLRIEQTKDIYEDFADNRILFVNQPASAIADTLMALDKENADPIKIIIDSHGGDVEGMWTIIDTIPLLQSPVWTFARNAQSAAAMIFLCGAIGYRFVFPHARIMIHQPEDFFMFFIRGMKEEEHERRAIELRIIKEGIAGMILSHLRPGVTTTKEQVLKDLKEEKWMSAQEAIDYGIADKLAEKGQLY